MRKIIILFGPPGIGKGTVGTSLNKDIKMPLVSVGNLLREGVKNQSVIGKKAENYMTKGELVPDDLVLELLKERIMQQDASTGFVLDGFPRNHQQVVMLEKIFKDGDICFVLNLEGSDKIIIERLSNRRICEKCGAIYHLINIPPKKSGICDICEGKLIQRVDDTPQVIKKRLDVFKNDTKPILDFYKKKGCLYSVFAEGKLSETLEQIYKIIN
ncbi:MAG: nucleoside monophosphate kinase [Candidatus Omnitrophica bacterium]|jgi:adenylate kinase|nr:nucleoside monophosphate kinase [Candidatus Omnitrophota bacterium]